MGWRVLVQSSEGNYVGYICWMLDHCGRLGLEQVSIVIEKIHYKDKLHSPSLQWCGGEWTGLV